MKKRVGRMLTMLLCVLAVCLVQTPSKAASVTTLQPNKTYQYNLDKKGSKEKISYSLGKSGANKKITIKINGKTAHTTTLGRDFYKARMQVLDINKSDRYLDLWVYAYEGSDDLGYAGLYRYQNKTLKRIWQLTEDTNGGKKMYCRKPGYLASTDGKGKFVVVMDRAVNTGYLTGSHWDRVGFKISGSKVSQVSKTGFLFQKIQTMSGTNKPLKTAKSLKLYKDHNKKKGSFTVKKGTSLTPKKSYISGKVVYVQYALSSGKTGWLCSSDYKNPSMFTNIGFAG